MRPPPHARLQTGSPTRTMPLVRRLRLLVAILAGLAWAFATTAGASVDRDLGSPGIYDSGPADAPGSAELDSSPEPVLDPLRSVRLRFEQRRPPVACTTPNRPITSSEFLERTAPLLARASLGSVSSSSSPAAH